MPPPLLDLDRFDREPLVDLDLDLFDREPLVDFDLDLDLLDARSSDLLLGREPLDLDLFAPLDPLDRELDRLFPLLPRRGLLRLDLEPDFDPLRSLELLLFLLLEDDLSDESDESDLSRRLDMSRI